MKYPGINIAIYILFYKLNETNIQMYSKLKIYSLHYNLYETNRYTGITALINLENQCKIIFSDFKENCKRQLPQLLTNLIKRNYKVYTH